MNKPNPVQVTFAFHPADYAAFQAAARAAGLDEQTFGVLAIHLEAKRSLYEQPSPAASPSYRRNECRDTTP